MKQKRKPETGCLYVNHFKRQVQHPISKRSSKMCLDFCFTESNHVLFSLASADRRGRQWPPLSLTSPLGPSFECELRRTEVRCFVGLAMRQLVTAEPPPLRRRNSETLFNDDLLLLAISVASQPH